MGGAVEGRGDMRTSGWEMMSLKCLQDAGMKPEQRVGVEEGRQSRKRNRNCFVADCG